MLFERKKYKRLGEILIEKGYITQTELEKAIQKQKEVKKPLGDVLVNLGYVTWDEIVRALAEQFDVEVLEEVPPDIPLDVINRIPRGTMESLRVVPIDMTEDGRLVVVTDSAERIPRIRSELRFLTGNDPKILLTTPVTFEYIYKTHVLGNPAEEIEGIFTEAPVLEENELEEAQLEEEEEAPVVKLVSMIIHKAIEKDASDIHIEPFRNQVKVRYRIDGILRNIMSYPKIQHNAVVIRIKIMANLNISERRLPQDGKFYLKIAGEQYDFRVSTMPSVFGEKVVMRILKVSAANRELTELGYTEYNEKRIYELLKHPYGIILVTGPTGSGKSTTLVAMINELKSESVNILTAEDPVEYTIDGVTQCQVRPEIGLTFARYLRSFLRQDPDIIMVGEIRDTESAQLAVEASLTGHLILSTLHTNDAPSAIDRLRNLGVDSRLISTSLIGVISQRLIRKINPRCEVRRSRLREDFIEFWEEHFKGIYDPVEYIPVESEGCNEMYRGRTAIGEVLIVNDRIREAIADGVGERELERIAKEEGMRPMFLDGLEKILKGETTVEEVLRVTSIPEEV